MPVTTTPRKRQLDEAGDTNQSTSVMEAKTTKPDIEKVLANMVADSEELQQKKIQMEDKKPKTTNRLKSLLFELQCQIFKDLPDKDLINVMLSDSSYEDAAGNVLQGRKIYLQKLSYDYEPQNQCAFLRVDTDTRIPVGTGILVSHRHYDLNVENAAALCEGYEEKKGNYLSRAIHILISYYNSSAAVVTGCIYTNVIPLTLEAFFGAAPGEPSDKIKIGHLVLNAHTVVMLKWFCPTHLAVHHSPNWLISQKELKELIVGFDRVSFRYTTRDACVDEVMEACEAKHIHIAYGTYWSDESILSVAKANANRDSKGATRTIDMFSMRRSKTQWKELFASLSTSFEEIPAIRNERFLLGLDVQWTIGMPKCTFEYYGSSVKLILH